MSPRRHVAMSPSARRLAMSPRRHVARSPDRQTTRSPNVGAAPRRLRTVERASGAGLRARAFSRPAAAARARANRPFRRA
jgi:hypothetical protein